MEKLFSFVILMLLYPCLISNTYMDRNNADRISVASATVDNPDHLFWAKLNLSCHLLLKDCTEYLDLLPPSSSQFTKPAMVLGLMQVGCLAETDQLYLDLLKDEDTRKMFQLLTDLVKTSTHEPSAQRHSQKHVLELDLLRYNLESLYPVAQSTHHLHCSGFQQESKNVFLNGLELGLHSSLLEAKEHCDRLGPSCAGVSLDRLGGFHSMARYGGYIMPENGTGLWLHHCTAEHRRKRSSDPECHSERELRIHNVMQWVPVVSGWYNAGSAIYYATQGCVEQAENRGIEASLDLGTDALLMATGGSSGPVALAVKPALKAGSAGPNKNTSEHSETFLSILVQEITKWQMLSCIGANTNTSLKHIEVCSGQWQSHIACHNMSQWEALLKLTGEFQEKIITLYSKEIFPMEVRQYLAPWFESQNWKLAAKDRLLATVQLQNLLEHLDTQYCRFTQADEILQKHNFRKFKLNVQLYQEQPEKLAEVIQYFLHHEQQILSEAQEIKLASEQPVQAPMKIGKQDKIEQRVNEAKERVLSVEQEVKFLEEQQEMFQFKFKTFTTESSEHASAPYIQKKKMELQIQLNELDKKRREVLDQVKELLGLCETLLGFLDQEITDWLQRQRLSCIGANTDTSLKQLESWVTKTVEVFLQLKRLLGILSDLSVQVSYERDPLKTDPQNLLQRLREMLECLIQKSFVVDKQPIMTYVLNRPLVLKTSTQFCVRARLLVNLPNLRHSMKVSYAMDKVPPNIKGYRRFNLLGPAVKTMEDVQGDGLVVEYKHLQLKEQKAGVRGKGGKGINDGPFGIMEELHIISLITHFDYEEVELDLEAVTLPFVVISNQSQFVGAFASVLWFNLLSSDPKDVTFFSKPPAAAPWSLLSEALSWQFSCCTKRGLNSDQQEMLGKKLCGTVPKEDSIVTWSKFSKENMSRVPFTFWVWFDAIVVLVKTHLENIWNDGYVMGFVSRSREDTLMKTMQQGTFLLRFSESIRDGGITCSWVDHQPDGTYTIRSVQPYTKKELSNIPLTEIIRNYQLLAEQNIPENPLKFLYPKIPKDEAFGPYYEQTSEMTLEYQKYMKRRLIMVSERSVDDCQLSISSGTPLYYPDLSDQDLSEYDPDVLQDNLADRELLNREHSSTEEASLELDIHMENLLINPNIDPFISSPSGEYHGLSLDSFDS